MSISTIVLVIAGIMVMLLGWIAICITVVARDQGEFLQLINAHLARINKAIETTNYGAWVRTANRDADLGPIGVKRIP